MRRKQMFLVIIIIFGLIIWIYRNSETQYTNIITTIERKNYFKNLLIEPLVENLCSSNCFFIILVTSYVGHVELRSAHRRAMPTEFLKTINATRIFLLAHIPKKEKYITQDAIIDENNVYGDILQGSFTEDYKNLTYKHLMGLQWASTYFNNVTYILKVDDDIVFNINQTYNFLQLLNKDENILIGYILNNTIPKRNKQNKWYVSNEEYPRNMYPPYLSGWYYIISPKLAYAITQEAPFHPHFWIDDIFVTGILTESLGIKLKKLPSVYWLEYYELLECCIKDMITKSLQCNYVVGPNGGRNNLIVEFKEALEQCKKKNCTERINVQDLKKMCITYKDRTIFSNGKAEIKVYYLGLNNGKEYFLFISMEYYWDILHFYATYDKNKNILNNNKLSI